MQPAGGGAETEFLGYRDEISELTEIHFSI
jgi:hypothetical protein